MTLRRVRSVGNGLIGYPTATGAETDVTRRLLEDAGITRGMKVLDVGCSPGDVSLMVADLVGEMGSVLGIDSSLSFDS